MSCDMSVQPVHQCHDEPLSHEITLLPQACMDRGGSDVSAVALYGFTVNYTAHVVDILRVCSFGVDILGVDSWADTLFSILTTRTEA